jgi:hypothetical protein
MNMIVIVVEYLGTGDTDDPVRSTTSVYGPYQRMEDAEKAENKLREDAGESYITSQILPVNDYKV